MTEQKRKEHTQYIPYIRTCKHTYIGEPISDVCLPLPQDRITLLNVFNKKIRTVLGYSCLSPRLPAEMIRIVKPSRHYAANFKGLFKSS
jgi:hypothetical protein